MRILFICADRDTISSSSRILDKTGIEIVFINGVSEETLQLAGQVDAVLLWHRQLRSMPRTHLLDLVRVARHAPLILALRTEDIGSVFETARLADGLIFVDANLDRLSEIIRLARRGYMLIPDVVGRQLLSAPAGHLSPSVDLSAVETQILEALGEGLTNRQIAYRLGLPESTVKHQVRDILHKLGFENRTQAAIYALSLRSKTADHHSPE